MRRSLAYSPMAWLRETSDGAILSVRAAPNAPQNQVVGILGDAIKIRLKAPPVDGKANKALIGFLSEILHLPRGQFSLTTGSSSRNKSVRITGLSAKEVTARLGSQGIS